MTVPIPIPKPSPSSSAQPAASRSEPREPALSDFTVAELADANIPQFEAFKGREGASPDWIAILEGYCILTQIPPPDYQRFSDRRGGRTSWTYEVRVADLPWTIKARFYYHGANEMQAKMDAAYEAVYFLEYVNPKLRPYTREEVNSKRKQFTWKWRFPDGLYD